jgi:hypothetical protein
MNEYDIMNGRIKDFLLSYDLYPPPLLASVDEHVSATTGKKTERGEKEGTHCLSPVSADGRWGIRIKIRRQQKNSSFYYIFPLRLPPYTVQYSLPLRCRVSLAVGGGGGWLS